MGITAVLTSFTSPNGISVFCSGDEIMSSNDYINLPLRIELEGETWEIYDKDNHLICSEIIMFDTAFYIMQAIEEKKGRE